MKTNILLMTCSVLIDLPGEEDVLSAKDLRKSDDLLTAENLPGVVGAEVLAAMLNLTTYTYCPLYSTYVLVLAYSEVTIS
jgi:hypothetical protein